MITPVLIYRFGMRTTALISLLTLPLEAIIFYYLATADVVPHISFLVVLTALVAFCTSIYTFVVNNSRFRWVSKAQAGTDFSMQSSLWNFGVWAAGSTAGFVAAAAGWPLFFPIAASLSFCVGMYYVLNFEHIERLVQAREAMELADG